MDGAAAAALVFADTGIYETGSGLVVGTAPYTAAAQARSNENVIAVYFASYTDPPDVRVNGDFELKQAPTFVDTPA